MTPRERLFLNLAILVSLLLHGAVVWAVMDMQLAVSPRSALFEPPPEPTVDTVPVSVQRSSEEDILRDDAADPAPDADPAADDPTLLQQQADRLLENIDLSDTFEPEEALAEADESAEEELAAEELAPLPAPAPLPGPAAAMDATDELLAMAEPVVSVPEFVAATDDVSPAPDADQSDQPQPTIDPETLGDLDDLFGSESGDMADADGTGDADAVDPLAGLADFTGPGGTGVEGGQIGGVPGGTGTRLGDPGMRGEGPGVGTVGVPELTQTLIETPTLTDEADEPVEHLDDDFTYELSATHEFARAQGLFDLLGVTGQEDEESWFEVRIAPRQSLRRLEPLNKDVVWAIDTSASISPWYVNQMRSGVRQALRTLNEGDRFNILLFAEEVQTLSSDGLLEASDVNIEKANTFLAQAQADGGTDVNRALSQLLVRDVPPDRVYQIILLSDGVPTRGSINPRNIIDIITRENDRVASIYAVGVSDEQDRKLLELLAYRNKGRVAYPENPQQTAATIAELAVKLRYPVVRDADFSAAGVDANNIFPQTPRDIYLGEPLSLFGRFGDDASRLSMQISGINREKTLDMTFTLDFRRATPGDEQLPRDWAFWKLHNIYRQITRDGETNAHRDELEFLRRRYNLQTPY